MHSCHASKGLASTQVTKLMNPNTENLKNILILGYLFAIRYNPGNTTEKLLCSSILETTQFTITPMTYPQSFDF